MPNYSFARRVKKMSKLSVFLILVLEHVHKQKLKSQNKVAGCVEVIYSIQFSSEGVSDMDWLISLFILVLLTGSLLCNYFLSFGQFDELWMFLWCQCLQLFGLFGKCGSLMTLGLFVKHQGCFSSLGPIFDSFLGNLMSCS